MRRLLSAVSAMALVGTAACHDVSGPADPATPQLARGTQQPGDYIVVFAQGAGDPGDRARDLTATHGGQIRNIYRNVIRGFAVRGLPAAAVDAIAQNPLVAYIEPDAEVQLVATTQSNATWGLDRVDQRDRPLSTTYTYNNTGSGANAYIFDTGVRRTHNDFGGRVQYVPNGANGDFVGDGHGSAEDCHGHGTHVAGSVGGAQYGVAKGVALWAARVVNCSGGGQASMLIAALDWCDQNCVRPAVVNMSLGYGNVQSIRDAVEDLSSKGVTSVAAAGNGNFLGTPQNACSQAPAGAPSAITVGASSSSDTEASFSNYGTCVDILAPGVSITSAWYTSNTATNTISGTSMATPHVVGAVALYLTAEGNQSPSNVQNAIIANASLNKISLHSASLNNGTPNRLLYTLNFGDGGGGTNSPPNASFTFACTDLSCTFNGSGSSDPDGSISSYAWSFGDNATGSGATASHTYSAAGTYTVTLTVMDNGGLSDSESQSVTVTAPSSGGITLAATGYKVRGLQKADLSWSGATSSSVDVYRDGTRIITTANDGFHTDHIDARGGGSYSYRVCEAGTTTCSSLVTVTF
jgi:PKD repeat protein